MEILKKDSGVSLAETMIAVLVALIGVFSIGSLIFQATVTNKNQGTEVTRATIYAQDKMEKLLSLDPSSTDSNGCGQSAALQPATCNTSGITAGGWTQGLLAGGATSPIQSSCPSSGASVGYVDYVDTNGAQFTGNSCSTMVSPTGAGLAYVRMWQVQDVCTSTSPATPVGCVGGPTGGPTLKQVTVAVWSQAAIGQGTAQSKPVVILTSYLSNPY